MTLTPASLGEAPSGRVDGVPYSPLYGDVYHPAWGAWNQARHVFMAGNGLPTRWAGQDRFVILETGFGLGNNFLATWSAWRDDPQRSSRLVFVSVEKHPLTREDLRRVHGLDQADPLLPNEPAHRPLAQQLVDAWPVLTPGMHSLQFSQPGLGEVTLLLAFGDIAEVLPQLLLRADAFYLDGFAPAKNPDMWDEHLLSRIGRQAAPNATAATWSVARGVRDGLTKAGFVVEKVAGMGGKRDITQATFQPRHTPLPPPGSLRVSEVPVEHRHAIILGGGLAGCASAWALARQGWRCTLIEAQGGVAQAASGNPGGLFHAILHGEDGIHARAYRAAALRTASVAAPLVSTGELAGQVRGLLRLDGKTSAEDAHALLARLGMPTEHVRWLSADDAHVATGVQTPSGGWLFGRGGWLHPAGLAAWFLDQAQQMGGLTTRFNVMADQVRPSPGESGLWEVLGTSGDVLAAAPTLVLACGTRTAAMAAMLPGAAALPMSSIRGQVTALDAPAPHLPIAGAGYALGLREGRLLCGATTQSNDPEPAIRSEDHLHNLRQAERIGCQGLPLPADGGAWEVKTELFGRVGWRAATPDRLPYVGALPLDPSHAGGPPMGGRLDQPRFVPRLSTATGGVFLMGGLGSRGITWAALAAELLASWVTGSPSPVEADLREALDPARMVSRAVTRGRKDAAAPSA